MRKFGRNFVEFETISGATIMEPKNPVTLTRKATGFTGCLLLDELKCGRRSVVIQNPDEV